MAFVMARVLRPSAPLFGNKETIGNYNVGLEITKINNTAV
jgi:hypothetical protein